MVAAELISEEIPPLRLTDSGLKALNWMDEFKVTHLPVIDGKKYVGILAETDILDLELPDKKIGDLQIQWLRPLVFSNVHIFEVMRLISDLHLSVIPIVDEDENYLGATHTEHLMRLIVGTTSIAEPGGIIILNINARDYSLAQISQIVESNGAKILSSYITSAPESMEMEVTLKINKKDLNAIIKTFERFEYTIGATFHSSKFGDDLNDRYESLMNFLNL